MYRAIVVPLDGSLLSERALPLASALARATGARLVLIQAVRAAGTPGPALSELQTRMCREAQTYLDQTAQRLREDGLTVATATPADTPDQAILTTADLHEADLIVMTTHGRSGLGRLIHGSVAESVLQRSPAPVLLVHGGEAADAGPPGPIERVLVPLDGSAFAETALIPAVALSQALGASLTLLRVVPPNQAAERALASGTPGAGGSAPGSEATQYLAQLADRVRAGGAPVETILRFGSPSDVIIQESQAGVGLLAMATHGRTGLDRIFLGSVAMQVLTKGKLPVLLVRPTEMRLGLAAA